MTQLFFFFFQNVCVKRFSFSFFVLFQYFWDHTDRHKHHLGTLFRVPFCIFLGQFFIVPKVTSLLHTPGSKNSSIVCVFFQLKCSFCDVDQMGHFQDAAGHTAGRTRKDLMAWWCQNVLDFSFRITFFYKKCPKMVVNTINISGMNIWRFDEPLFHSISVKPSSGNKKKYRKN